MSGWEIVLKVLLDLQWNEIIPLYFTYQLKLVKSVFDVF